MRPSRRGRRRRAGRLLQANSGKVPYATPDNGTIGHSWDELFKSSTATSLVDIAYCGIGPALNDTRAGEVSAYFDQAPLRGRMWMPASYQPWLVHPHQLHSMPPVAACHAVSRRSTCRLRGG